MTTELLLFLVGTLVYGFLARELWTRPGILPGNRALRAAALCLFVWYAGSLLDEMASILLPSSSSWEALGPAVDVLRGWAWLSSFPLLAHAIWSLLEPGARPHGAWLVPGYLTLLPFFPIALEVVRMRETVLSDVGRNAYTLFVVHVTVATVVSSRLVVFALGSIERPDLERFLRWLLGSLIAVEGLVVVGAFLVEVWNVPVWRVLVEASGLVVGVTFLYFVRRYNLLSLSLSNRSLRRFSSILALTALLLFAGAALQIAGSEVFRRLLAVGLLLAVLGGVFYGPLTAWASRRWPRLARLVGRGISQEEIDRVAEKLQDLELSESALIELTCAEVGRLAGTEVRFVTNPTKALEPIWTHFDRPASGAFNRLSAPSPALADALAACELHAVFPVRTSKTLEGILALEPSVAGGGYEDGEMESLQLVVRQLEAALEIRRLLSARLAAERRESERERLSMLGMVTASLAHELKNPLSSMKALAQTVREELSDRDPESEEVKDLGLIVDQVNRLSGVAREILDFARPAAAKEGTELSALIEGAFYVLAPEARRRGITIARDEVEVEVQAPGTPATWQTIIFNLMLNAIRHAPAGSTVRLRLRRGPEQLWLECENQGPAIPEETAKRLFDPFVSGESARSDGVGLGLSLVHGRIRELGGSIELVNEPDHIVFRIQV